MTKKYALKAFIQKTHKAMIRRRKAWAPESYLLKLPADPKDLLRSEPGLYNRIFQDGAQPTKNKLDSELASSLDRSFQCRGGQREMQSVSTISCPMASNDSQINIAQVLQGLVQVIARPRMQEDRDPIQFLYPGAAMQQRSFAAMRGQAALTAPQDFGV